MKISVKRRLLSLLLALAMTFALTPTAWMAPGEGGSGGSDDSGDPPAAGVLTDMRLSSDDFRVNHTGEADYGLLLEPNASAEQGGATISVNLDPSDDQQVQNLHVTWSPTDSPYVGVSEMLNGHRGIVFGKSAGKALVTVSAGSAENRITKSIDVTVSGIQLSEKLAAGIEVLENSTVTITAGTDFTLFGNAASDAARLDIVEVNGRKNVYPLVNDKSITLEGRQAGNVTMRLTVSSGGRTYTAEFPVTVLSNEQTIEWTEGCSPAKPLKFSALEERIVSKYREVFPGGTFSSIIGLSVPTAQGTMYLGYNSPEDTGAGAGSSMTYYYRTAARGPYIQDLTFVPNPSYTGEKAYIAFTAQGTDSAGTTRTF